MKITIELTNAELEALRASIDAELESRAKAEQDGSTPEPTLALPGGNVAVKFERIKKPGYRQRIADAKIKAVEAMLRGESVPSIAKACGVSEFSIYQWRSQAVESGMSFPTPPRPHKENENFKSAVADMMSGMSREAVAKKYGVSVATITTWKHRAKQGGAVFPDLKWSAGARAKRKRTIAKQKKVAGVDVRTAMYDVRYYDRGLLGRTMLESKTLAECHDLIKTLLNVQKLWPVGTGPEEAVETFMNPEKGMKDGYCVTKSAAQD